MDKTDRWYSDDNVTKTTEHLLCEGDYKLVVTSHPTRKGCWNYTKGKLYKGGSEWVLMHEIRRNYHVFWYEVVAHRNGHRYLFCGEDYQGYTCINMDTGEYRNHLPPEAFFGAGYCWCRVMPLIDGTVLAVGGCVWAGPEEVRFYDFSEPDLWPLLPVGGCLAPEIHGWRDGQFLVGESRLIRKSDGLDLEWAWERDEISEEEIQRLEDAADSGDTSEAEYRQVSSSWVPPTPAELYTRDVDYLWRLDGLAERNPDRYSGWADRRGDMVERLRRYWDRIPEADRVDIPSALKIASYRL